LPAQAFLQTMSVFTTFNSIDAWWSWRPAFVCVFAQQQVPGRHWLAA